jgi:tetratricopeptide (TPR) repeat protein
MKRSLLKPELWPLLFLLVLVVVGCNSAWVSSGILYQDQGNWEKAENMFRKGLWYNEEDAPAHFFLAGTLAYRAEEDYLADDMVDSARIKFGEAYEHYQIAKQLDPEKYDTNPDAEKEEDKHLAESGIQSMYAKMFNAGVGFMRGEQYEDAITYFEIAAVCDPRGKAYFDARLLSLQLQYNQAIPDGEEADETALQAILDGFDELEVDDNWESADKDRQELVKAQASVYRAMGQDTRANALFEELLAQTPEDRDLLRTVAEARLVVGDREGAHELYVRALDIMAADPEVSDDRRFKFADRAINNAIRAELYPEAIALAERAARWAASSSERSKLARSRARSYFEMEDFDLAVQTLEPVVTDGGLDPTNAEAWQIYYLALNKIGRDADAMTARARYQELKGL